MLFSITLATENQFGPTICFKGLDNAVYYYLATGMERSELEKLGFIGRLVLENAHVPPTERWNKITTGRSDSLFASEQIEHELEHESANFGIWVQKGPSLKWAFTPIRCP